MEASQSSQTVGCFMGVLLAIGICLVVFRYIAVPMYVEYIGYVLAGLFFGLLGLAIGKGLSKGSGRGPAKV